MLAVESRILIRAIPAIERAMRVKLVPITGKSFQIKDGDTVAVDTVTGSTRTLEIKTRQEWFGDFLFEDWSDRNKARGWAYYCKAAWIAAFWEDRECVCVLDGPRALAWYQRERQIPGRFGREFIPNIKQPNTTVNHAVKFSELRQNGLILFEDFSRPAVAQQCARQQSMF
jgi:hypothetical protein